MKIGARNASRLFLLVVRTQTSCAEEISIQKGQNHTPKQTFWMCTTCAFINPSKVQRCTRCSSVLGRKDIFASKMSSVQSKTASVAVGTKSLSNLMVPKLAELDFRTDEAKESFSWKCRLCSSLNVSGFVCQKCLSPHVVEDLALRFLHRNSLSTKEVWMCVNCKAVMSFDCGTCFKCRSTNNQFCMENWRCRWCSKGHRSLNSEQCCPRFERPRVPYKMPWMCACGETNPIISSKCSLCHRPQPYFTVVQKDWICQCGRINPSFQRSCEACNSSMNVSIKGKWMNAGNTVLDNWLCHNCDIVNEKKYGLCRKCKATREGAHISSRNGKK